MKIAFADFINWDYKVESAYQMALGGSQSALCYLAEALAKQGHEVFLLNNTSTPGMSCGVMCLPLSNLPHQLLKSFDALIVQNLAGEGMEIRSLIGDNIPLILWTGCAHDQRATQALQNSTERDVYDGIALVSNWQRDRFCEHFGIDLTCTGILRNAISPFFCGLFPDDTTILAQKSNPPILAYTSTPFRGLDILLEVFPSIRSAVPGTRLKVFSSMKIYQYSEAKDQSEYGWLYRQCHQTEGVEYIGCLPQRELARQLKSVTVVAYPNTFTETSSIAVMEAMASGCWTVTSDLGALPETTAGFARLIPIEDDWEGYKERFVQETVEVLRKCRATDTTEAEAHLRQQVNFVNSSYTWSIRALEWAEWLSSLRITQQAYQYLIKGEYSQATTLYESAIEAFPTVMFNYWYLGLTLLLQGEEVEAQATWMSAMLNGEPEQVDAWTSELVQVLRAESERRKAMADFENAELIQGYIEQIMNDYS